MSITFALYFIMIVIVYSNFKIAGTSTISIARQTAAVRIVEEGNRLLRVLGRRLLRILRGRLLRVLRRRLLRVLQRRLPLLRWR
jgi:hypothetical protein